jgi:hypothetical protein
MWFEVITALLMTKRHVNWLLGCPEMKAASFDGN